MDINNIELTSSICQSLFSNTLVETKYTGKISSELPGSQINHIGENRKKIVFVVNNEKGEFLNDEEMEVLNNLLAACKMSIVDISLVNFYPLKEITYESITEQLKAKHILLFGITCAQLGLPFNIPDFQVQKFQDQIYLFNPPFSDLITNKNSKMALWNCLKKMFLQ